MSTSEILGCSFSEAYEILEGRDYSNGCRDRQIDHIIPLSWGKTEEELIRLSHISNLQYLSKGENLIKSNKLEPRYFITEVLDNFADIIYRQILKEIL